MTAILITMTGDGEKTGRIGEDFDAERYIYFHLVTELMGSGR